ncbi:CRISPR-associated helicase Cas3' [Streptomyces sp. NBC_00237]|uniref:CRISPR-associated helicase Cas3' n=1 Tax=Streptomyces sp. NBC_00237 TaxID=2975687 RepID=UPI002258B010|nr:CRISPR-associated helicase Cas3' [Streptomyces sp. NBC_00237]MCX5206044.1 CRISPR-associated helicase Cas3' [Streptomyces sp. NBC_00237]
MHETQDAKALDDVIRELGLGAETAAWLGVLWGKSAQRGGGASHLLLGHLLDTAAVAECMWRTFVAPWMRWRLDEVTGGRGRLFFMWVCGIHDCGKATPAFQSLDAEGAARVRAAGLVWGPGASMKPVWRHDKAGGVLLSRVLGQEWGPEQSRWVWPLVAGHHGVFPGAGILQRGAAGGEPQGRGEKWQRVQRALLDVFTRAVGFEDIKSVCPVGPLSKAEQLALSGMIVMADWVASNSEHFAGQDNLAGLSLATARLRATTGWEALGLRGGWGELPLPVPGEDLVRVRFGEPARPAQVQLMELASEMPASGLLVVEAPMGEGKTKGALAAAEILAARFGLDGVFVAMPTQATSDPMYTQVLDWVATFDPELADQVALLHGKHMFNPRWQQVWQTHASGNDSHDDLYGAIDEDDAYGLADTGCAPERRGPALWFLGRKRGLLTGFGVGTVDHLLYAATRTRHVMLRFAGLAGKVVIVDEVHAADVYMRQFLTEALRWLGQARVPVVLLSATLPPAQRQLLVDAYLAGASGADIHVRVPEPVGYPCVTGAWVAEGQPVVHRPRAAAKSWRPSIPVQLSWLADVSDRGEAVAERVLQEIADGGVVLVILNSVDRAQGVYEQLTQTLAAEVHLLHGRLCATHRADRTDQCLSRLGPGAGRSRPKRMVVVATQLAEQSFDVDADLLITDLAPTDLLLQRIGRLHRHDGTPRPARMQSPRVIVTGIEQGPAEVPRLLRTSEFIYGVYTLLRAAALVREAAGDIGAPSGELAGEDWMVPTDVPRLVAAAYSDVNLFPAQWQATEDEARIAWEQEQAKRTAAAQELLLTGHRDWGRPTLAGLHYQGSARFGDEGQMEALVRDGEEAVEVVIVRKVPGGYTALNGTRLGIHGEASEAPVVEAVLGGTTRLPGKLTRAAEADLAPLPGWSAHPWLRYTPALVLDEGNTTRLGGYEVAYDDDMGLIVK